MKVGINGMGRIGRLALRAAFGAAERQADDPYAGNRLQVVHLNELKGGAATTAHLLAFDTVQGKWRTPIAAEGEDRVRIGDKTLSFSGHATPAEIPWGELGVDVAVDLNGYARGGRPGIFVQRIVLNAHPEKRIEQRTIRKG